MQFLFKFDMKIVEVENVQTHNYHNNYTVININNNLWQDLFIIYVQLHSYFYIQSMF